MDVGELKRAAALRAVEYVQDGMKVGLGTGSTAKYAVEALGGRMKGGLNITGVPTSERTAQLARQVGIPLSTLEETPHLDITIDGADEVVLDTLDVIKGLGGALLREKIVALASAAEVLIVDAGKVVQKLGERTPVPVEVVTFGWSLTCEALERLGCEPVLRKLPDGSPYVTDQGNYLLDCHFYGIDDATGMGQKIKAITGVVEHGLFIHVARRVIVAGEQGVQVYER